METQSINPKSGLNSYPWVSIHYEVIKMRYENDIRDNPNDFDEYLRNALSKYFEQDLKGSLAVFDNAIAMNPGKAEYYYYRGLIRFAMDDYPGVVIRDCSKALKIKPGFDKAILRRGVAEYLCGLFTKALEDLNWSIALDPQCGEAWFVRGIIKITTGYKKSGQADIFKGQNLGYKDGCLIYDGKWE
jgi:tetratricopeptide (TPR) repeat protein